MVGCYTFKNNILPNIGQLFPVTASTPALGSGSLTARSGGLYKVSASTPQIDLNTSTISGKWIVINAPDTKLQLLATLPMVTGHLHR